MQWLRVMTVVGTAVSLCSCSFQSSVPNGPPGSQQANAVAAQSRPDSTYRQLMSQTAGVENANGFTISSTTFKNDSTVPKVMRGYAKPQCFGGDQSPALSWSGSPRGTKSFAIVLFDVTANFGHWGIYNLRPDRTKLPQGIKLGNSPGQWLQVTDDAGVHGYFGPCPPNVKPLVHKYVFTIYALYTTLPLKKYGKLPRPTLETLFRAMVGKVIGRTSITGYAAIGGK